MKVAIYTESFVPYLSGVTVSVHTYAKALLKLGHEVLIMAPGYPHYKDNFPFKVFRFPSIPAVVYPEYRLSIPFSLKHRSFIKKNRPDIIHSHSPFQLGYLSRRYAYRHKIPFVLHFHTLLTEYLHNVPLIPKKLTAKIVIWIIRKFCNKCDLIIAPTKIVKNILIEKYKINQPIEVLPTGIEEELVAAASPEGVREKWGIKETEKLLLYVGRLSKEKNIKFLISAFAEINNLEPNTKLMIIAFGPQESELKNHAKKLNISDKVIFTLKIPRAEIYNYIKAADLFVSASKTETQGLVISEAKACSIPSVAINAQGSSDMIIDGYDGYLTKDDRQDFVSKVVSLITDKEKLQEFGKNGLKNATDNYMSLAITKKLEKLYNKVLQGGFK